jgi:uncharacterized protein
VTSLRLNVVELLRRPGTDKHLHLESTTDELELQDPRLPSGPVSADIRLDVLTDGVVVTGTVTASWHGECRRCLAPVGGALVVDVQELYQTVVIDPDAFPILHDQLDLTPMVREALMLDAPAAPLCRPDCAGICPTCGADRNQSPCECVPASRDDRWAALDTLREESR